MSKKLEEIERQWEKGCESGKMDEGDLFGQLLDAAYTLHEELRKSKTDRFSTSSELTSTCLETLPNGTKIFNLIFGNVQVSLSEKNFQQLILHIGEFHMESKEDNYD